MSWDSKRLRKSSMGLRYSQSATDGSIRGDFMIILKLLGVVEHYETKWVLHG
jgi:hypothetical protein